MKRIFCVFILIVLVVGTLGIAPQHDVAAQETVDFGAIDAYVAEMMADYDVPGAGIAIVRDGEVLYVNGYGVRDVEFGITVTENTQFAIGSITKSFTALGIAQLVDAGLVDLDTPVIEYLPDFRVADEEATQTLTLRHFLSHSSGLPTHEDDFWYYERPTRQEIIDDMVNYELTAQPGEIFQYHNQNFVVAARVLEVVTGQTWEDYTREHIFAPLGMDTANFDINEMQALPDYAQPHVLDIPDGLMTIPFFDGMAGIAPSGAINSSVLELANYAIFQLGDGTFNGQQLVSAELLDEMHTEQVEGYAMGWVPTEYRDYDVVYHDGGIDGFRSLLAMVPSENTAILVLANASNLTTSLFNEAVAYGIFDRLMGEEPDTPIDDEINASVGYDPDAFHTAMEAARTFEADPAVEAQYLGEYSWVQGELSVEDRDGILTLIISTEAESDELELVGFEPNGYLVNFPASIGTVISFDVLEDGRVTIAQNGVVFAQRSSDDQSEISVETYTDPEERFTVEYPSTLIVQELDGLVVFNSVEPAGVVVVAVGESDGSDIEGDILSFIQALDPAFNLEPNAVETLTINDKEWTQVEYLLPSDQVVIVRAFAEDGTGYLMLGQGAVEDTEALEGLVDLLTTGFSITTE